MQIPLAVDPNDYRWQLLKKILNIFEMRKTKKIIAKFTQVKTAINCIKITLTSMFFSTRISHVVEELRRREDLREFLRIKEEEAKIFQEVMDELKRRRIVRRGDVIVMDKGFYAYRNYLIGINEYRIVPLIFPRSNFDLERLDGLLSYPLSIFDSKSLDEEKRRFRVLKSKLLSLLQRWREFKAVRSVIEDVFKLAKSFGLRRLHRYTGRSVYKFAALNVLLVGVVVALGFREKRVLQRLAEM